MKAIEINGLTKKYGTNTAIDGISFDVNEGELFAYLGENGAGKSTTINILSTILKKTSGEAKVFGLSVGNEDDKIRNLMGIVFQNSVLDAKLTVKENLSTRGAYYGFCKREIMDRLKVFSDAFMLDEIWTQKYESLSGGQRRRVDIIRALINRPRILFLDEPTTGLDPMSRKMVWDYVNYLREDEKMTIFLTTHYMEETRDADNVVILDKGKIIAEGSPSMLKNKYTKKRLVWYTEDTVENRALMKDYEFKYDADHYNMYFEGQINEFLYRSRDKLKDFEIIKGTMDDVFLNLTGKECKNE